MQTTKTRIAVVSAATLALAMLGSSAVAAQSSSAGDLAGDFGRHQSGGRGDDGMLGGRMGPGMHGIFGDDADGFIRSDVTYETDAGIVVDRTDQGTVTERRRYHARVQPWPAVRPRPSPPTPTPRSSA